MDKPFFIMLNHQKRDFSFPIVDDNEEVMFFSTVDEAREVMKGHLFAEAFGFEIFERGTGN